MSGRITRIFPAHSSSKSSSLAVNEATRDTAKLAAQQSLAQARYILDLKNIISSLTESYVDGP